MSELEIVEQVTDSDDDEIDGDSVTDDDEPTEEGKSVSEENLVDQVLEQVDCFGQDIEEEEEEEEERVYAVEPVKVNDTLIRLNLRVLGSRMKLMRCVTRWRTKERIPSACSSRIAVHFGGLLKLKDFTIEPF